MLIQQPCVHLCSRPLTRFLRSEPRAWLVLLDISPFGKESQRSHWRRVDEAQRLSSEHGLDDVSDLLRDLNEVRKNEVYGDVVAPELDAQDVATMIERYVESIAALVEGR